LGLLNFFQRIAFNRLTLHISNERNNNMELLLFMLIAGVLGYFFGKSRRSKPSPPASEQVVDVSAKDTPEVEDSATE
jgi:hypothetical protein